MKPLNNVSKLLKLLFNKPLILKNLERPNNLPPYATDCGFNHGEPKEENEHKKMRI